MAPTRTSAMAIALAVTLTAGCSSRDEALDTGPSPVVANAAAPAPSLAGTWAGTYRVVECPRADGVLSNMCTSVGNAYPFTLELKQQGQTVTGRYALANVWFDLAPSEFTDQNVTLNGAGRIDSAGVQVQVTWALSVGRPWLGGTAVLEWTADAGGGATLRATIAGQPLLSSSAP